ncbi:MAG: SDR family NAD(P)-dependent oxidoreductase [Clostridiales bacterium]|jgi:NAD(P)-dependent dehydrogenase (short-subunit alcohol dehydrogenase family)|nr:SDR family NAD(P)-dependent oxidoreductase [Clostridiales bacterium]
MSKTALIFGASSGIGMESAKLFLKNGYTVYNAAREECPIGGVVSIETDVANLPDIVYAVGETVKNEGSLDVLVYSAGYSMAAPLEYAKQTDYRYLFEVNFFGFLEAVKAAAPQMKKQGGGRIVAISSIGAVLPIPFDGFYSASKAALNAMVRELNLEFQPYNIRLVSVMPGGTKTGFTMERNVYSDEDAGYYAERLNSAVRTLAKTEQHGMNPARVAKTVYRAATKDVNSLISSGGINKLYHMGSRLLPLNATDAGIASKYFQ